METKKFYLDYIFCYPEFRNEKIYFEGIDLGGRWNGWSRPAFSKEEAERIASMINRTSEPDEQEMWFAINNDGNWYVERCEEGIYDYYEEILVDGKPYYCIGTGCWCWAEWEDRFEKQWRFGELKKEGCEIVYIENGTWHAYLEGKFVEEINLMED